MNPKVSVEVAAETIAGQLLPRGDLRLHDEGAGEAPQEVRRHPTPGVDPWRGCCQDRSRSGARFVTGPDP